MFAFSSFSQGSTSSDKIVISPFPMLKSARKISNNSCLSYVCPSTMLIADTFSITDKRTSSVICPLMSL
jgi:hypothetical protein